MSPSESGASLEHAASRLVADLMPIAIVVADTGTGAGAAWLRALAPSGAEAFAPGLAQGFDLAILLACAEPQGASALVEGLAAISDRLLFVPQGGVETALDAWFELFAEQGYQPVVEYDASFLGQGAFLVDRNATAAETELSAFAERIAMGGALAASTQRAAVLEAELVSAGGQEALRAELAASQAACAAALAREAEWRNRSETAEAELASFREQAANWHGAATLLAEWVRAACRAPGRDTLSALRRAGGAMPPGRLAGLLAWAARPTRREQRLLADAARLRANPDFDTGWYVASQPALAAEGGDPVWHYVLRGGLETEEPARDSTAPQRPGATFAQPE